MATKTVFKVVVTTERDLMGNDVEKFMKTVESFLPLLKLTGLGERVGIKDLDIRLSDKTVS